ncbi:uncharacterized protein LOC129939226 [Eupeodes corollae]|uniref:uncharacterized protein LOC129939226 n=1 Tax=Eupeodes corollae TaxID=290404 RepID=UPI002490E2AA|nr:uncharacterized protein LOC129939226 [Eupeodes corollae]
MVSFFLNMLTRNKKIQQLHILLMLLITLPSTFVTGKLKFSFDDIKCAPFNGYVERYSCSVDKITDEPRLNVDVQMKKEVQSSYIDFIVNAKAANREPITIFKAERITYCSAQVKQISDPIFMTFKEMFKKSGTLPEGCPIPANFRYLLNNITLDTDLLPSFSPAVKLKIDLVFYDRKFKYFAATTLARLTHLKKKTKGNNKN